ncbi:MAG TPA: ABC transporter substrate-binding protein, partial [Acidimicrobiia bacterium]
MARTAVTTTDPHPPSTRSPVRRVEPDSILEAEAAAKSQGISTCYTNNSVNFGAVDFTADVLQIKQANCGAVAGSFVEASNLALSRALKEGGMSNVKQYYFTGYDSSTTSQASDAQGFDGDYVSNFASFSPPNAGGQALLDTLKKYDSSYRGGVPDFGLIGSAISTQLAVFGL